MARRTGPWMLALAVAANLTLLVYFKYSTFLIQNVDTLLPLVGHRTASLA